MREKQMMKRSPPRIGVLESCVPDAVFLYVHGVLMCVK